jgi:hypothetical protein
MSTILIAPGTKRQFDLAFDLVTEFGNRQKRLSWDDEVDFNIAFLMKEKESVNEVDKVSQKKN